MPESKKILAEMSFRVERPTTTLRELALAKMHDAILGFYFAPGERLVERKLTELLGTSRTVVREVIRHLESEGLVENLPHRGPVVARIDLAAANQIYELRMVIESLAARACAEAIDADGITRLEQALVALETAFDERDMRAVMKHTTRFYEVLFLAGGKAVAWGVVQNLNARINQLRSMTLSSPGRAKTGPGEMRAIFEAIKARDADAAELASRIHVQRAHAIAQTQMAAAE